MALAITYTLSNAGWADVTLRDGEQSAKVTFSYLHDSLLNLTEAAIYLLTGFSEEQLIIFMEEPGEHQLLLTPVGTTLLTAQLRWYNDWASWGMYPKDHYQSLLSFDTTRMEFATIVAQNLTHLWLTHGHAGYLEKWIEHEFPYNQYRKLMRLLKA